MTAFAEWMTSSQPPDSFETSLHGSVFLNGKNEILTASRREPTVRPKHGTNRVLIEPYHPDQNPGR